MPIVSQRRLVNGFKWLMLDVVTRSGRTALSAMQQRPAAFR